jgi:molybdopterin-guanine dinucleotide biosynthesis protein A
MGQDKALLEIAGEPILVRIARLAESFTERVKIIGRPERYSRFSWPVIPDVRTGQGPLAGVVTALKNGADWNLILSCDLPYLTSDWIEWLVSRRFETRCQAVVPESDSGLEPLCALYRKECYPTFAEALEKGALKLRDTVEQLQIDRIPASEWRRFSPDGILFSSMNTMQDYEFARQRLG